MPASLVPYQTQQPLTLSERLTANFYAWERRGRGWQVFDYPVSPEPPFRPFYHQLVSTPRFADDARKHTWLSGFIESVIGRFDPSRSVSDAAEVSDAADLYNEPEPEPSTETDTEIQVILPPTFTGSAELSEQFLLALSGCASPVSFEIIGLPHAIALQFACTSRDASLVEQQLKAHFPAAVFTHVPAFLASHWLPLHDADGLILDLGLSHEFMRPIKSVRNFGVDPLIALTGALGDIREQEMGIVQVIFQRALAPWSESIARAVTDGEGGSFFADAPDMVTLAREKISKPLFAATLRLCVRSPNEERTWELLRSLTTAFAQFARPMSNELMPLSRDDYEAWQRAEDLLARTSRRSGMILNSEELAAFVHLPSASVRSEKLVRETRKSKAAPTTLASHALVLGENSHAGKTVRVGLSPDQRSRHAYLIGASGTGKSTLLLNMIVQDLRSGEGLAVLDPHGDLIDQVLGYVPEHRIKDVILLDPSDEDYPVAFNILSAHSSVEQNLLASDLVAVFRRLSTSWGDQMTSVLGNAVLAFLESTHGGTLADLRRFLVEPDFRRSFLSTVRDPEVVYYWTKEFPLLAGKPQAPLLTRLDTFLRPKLIRRMVVQKENRLDIGRIMNEGKIVLAKLAQGAIGEENAHLLGTLLVSSFHRTALARQELAATDRRPFYLYIDEFHHFTTPSMASILSGARKYRLGLVLAHQDLRQLGDSEVASAVLANPATRICFRVGDADARKLAEGLSFFEAKDLQNLGVGEAIARVERSEQDFNLKTLPLPPLAHEVGGAVRGRVIERSRMTYASRREDVDLLLTPDRIARTEAPPVQAPSPAKGKASASPPQPPRGFAPSLPAPQAPAPLGRGGAQHQYLQQLIKRWTEGRGYLATIEQPILDGMGSVDVALEKDEMRIACEISVTTSPEHETSNVQKCLAAGFAYVAVISPEKKTLAKMKGPILSAVSEADSGRIIFCTPEELFAFLETLGTQAPGANEKVRGYKVKVKYTSVGEAEKKGKRQAVGQVILGALKRLRRKE